MKPNTVRSPPTVKLTPILNRLGVRPTLRTVLEPVRAWRAVSGNNTYPAPLYYL